MLCTLWFHGGTPQLPAGSPLLFYPVPTARVVQATPALPAVTEPRVKPTLSSAIRCGMCHKASPKQCDHCMQHSAEEPLAEAYVKFSHEKQRCFKSFLAGNHSAVSVTTDNWDASFEVSISNFSWNQFPTDTDIQGR